MPVDAARSMVSAPAPDDGGGHPQGEPPDRQPDRPELRVTVARAANVMFGTVADNNAV